MSEFENDVKIDKKIIFQLTFDKLLITLFHGMVFLKIHNLDNNINENTTKNHTEQVTLFYTKLVF